VQLLSDLFGDINIGEDIPYRSVGIGAVPDVGIDIVLAATLLELHDLFRAGAKQVSCRGKTRRVPPYSVQTKPRLIDKISKIAVPTTVEVTQKQQARDGLIFVNDEPPGKMNRRDMTEMPDNEEIFCRDIDQRQYHLE